MAIAGVAGAATMVLELEAPSELVAPAALVAVAETVTEPPTVLPAVKVAVAPVGVPLRVPPAMDQA
jgi:predicted nicotinamide N-methyase